MARVCRNRSVPKKGKAQLSATACGEALNNSIRMRYLYLKETVYTYFAYSNKLTFVRLLYINAHPATKGAYGTSQNQYEPWTLMYRTIPIPLKITRGAL